MGGVAVMSLAECERKIHLARNSDMHGKLAINENTSDIGCGPVNLNVTLARSFGWSEKALNRAWANLAKISRREASLSHRNGPVKGCPCITCDLRVPYNQLPKDYQKQRASWMARHLI